MWNVPDTLSMNIIYTFKLLLHRSQYAVIPLSNGTLTLRSTAVATASWSVLWGYSDATLTKATVHAVYPQSTLNGTPTHSSRTSTAFYETHLAGLNVYIHMKYIYNSTNIQIPSNETTADSDFKWLYYSYMTSLPPIYMFRKLEYPYLPRTLLKKYLSPTNLLVF